MVQNAKKNRVQDIPVVVGKQSLLTGNWIAQRPFEHSPESEFSNVRIREHEKTFDSNLECLDWQSPIGLGNERPDWFFGVPFKPNNDKTNGYSGSKTSNDSFFSIVVGTVGKRLSELTTDSFLLNEAEDIASHVIARAELEFQTIAIPDYNQASQEGVDLPSRLLGYHGVNRLYGKRTTPQQEAWIRHFESKDWIVNGWRSGDGHHAKAIRPGVILRRAKTLATDCVANGGYNRTVSGIETRTRGASIPRVEVKTENPHTGELGFWGETERVQVSTFDRGLHSPITESPRTVAFGESVLTGYHAIVMSKLSAEQKRIIESVVADDWTWIRERYDNPESANRQILRLTERVLGKRGNRGEVFRIVESVLADTAFAPTV